MVLVGYVILARMLELAFARRNTRRLLARGGYEAGQKHYPLIIAVHVGWIAALVFLVPADTPPVLWLAAVFAGVQVVRYWIIFSLGERWTTRVIVLPGASLVRRGPYRWLRHPNYVVVIAEIALLPLIFGAWEIALVFSILNTAILMHRIRIEEAVLTLNEAP
jgi:methyltransferase